jgi:hypothetical protein
MLASEFMLAASAFMPALAATIITIAAIIVIAPTGAGTTIITIGIAAAGTGSSRNGAGRHCPAPY